MSWLNAHRYAAGAAWRGLCAAPWQWLAGGLVIASATLLPLLLYLMLGALTPQWRALASTPEISVFMKPDANNEQIVRARTSLEQQLVNLRNAEVKTELIWIPKAQALKELQSQLRRAGTDAQALQSLADNPLPDTFIVRVPGLDEAGVTQLAAQLRNTTPSVDLVQVDSAWLATYQRSARLLTLLLISAAALFAVVIVAVTFNVTSTQALRLADEIEIARLIGATESFIRRPFIYRGALLGLSGAALALLLALAASLAVSAALQNFVGTNATPWQQFIYSPARWVEALMLLVATMALGGLGGGWAAYRNKR